MDVDVCVDVCVWMLLFLYTVEDQYLDKHYRPEDILEAEDQKTGPLLELAENRGDALKMQKTLATYDTCFVR